MLSGKITHNNFNCSLSRQMPQMTTRYTTTTLLTDDVCFRLRATIQKMWLYFDINKTNRLNVYARRP